jgi:hypothetical protein
VLQSASAVFPACQHGFVGSCLANALPSATLKKIHKYYFDGEKRLAIIEDEDAAMQNVIYEEEEAAEEGGGLARKSNDKQPSVENSDYTFKHCSDRKVYISFADSVGEILRQKNSKSSSNIPVAIKYSGNEEIYHSAGVRDKGYDTQIGCFVADSRGSLDKNTASSSCGSPSNSIYFPLTTKNLMYHIEINSDGLGRAIKCESLEEGLSSLVLTESKYSEPAEHAELDTHQVISAKYLNSPDCLDSFKSVYSSANSIISLFENKADQDSADLLHYQDINLEVQSSDSSMNRRLPVRGSSVALEERTAWNAILAWRIIFRLIQGRIPYDQAELGSHCSTYKGAELTSGCKPTLYLDIAEVNSEEKETVGLDGRAGSAHSNFDPALIDKPARFLGENEKCWYEKSNSRVTSSSFNNSMQFITKATTAANSGLTYIKSVLKVSKPKLYGHNVDSFSISAGPGAETNVQTRTSTTRETESNVHGNIDYSVKPKMRWYFRTEFHQICLALVNYVQHCCTAYFTDALA